MEKTAVSFLTDKFDLSWPAESDSAPPWGKDCAAFFAQQLPRYGVRVIFPEPHEQEGGWYIKASATSGVEIMVFVSWLPAGKPERNFWLIQLKPWPTLIPAFFRKKPTDEDYRVVCQAVDKVLTTDIGASEVRWLTDAELSKL